MSVDFWENAERFYATGIVMLGIVILIILIVITIAATSAKKENRLKIVIGLLILAGVIGLSGYMGHRYYQPYIAQAGYVNPLVRDRKPSFSGYRYYSRADRTTYSQLNIIETLRQLELYEEKEVTKSVTYLGQGDYYHFFEDEDGRITKRLEDVNFDTTTNETQFIGSQFVLKDKGFERIGFENPEQTMFREIVIPVSEEGRVYQPDDPYIIPKPEERMNDWNF